MKFLISALFIPATLFAQTGASQTSYAYPATGAAKSNVQAVLQRSVSVTDFGAKADGTDQTQNIQRAYSAAALAGASVHIPGSAQCYFVDTLYVPSGMITNGDGISSCIKKLPGNHPNPVINAGANFGAGGNMNVASAPSSNIWFNNLLIDGNKSNITGISGDGFNQGINFSGCSNCGTNGVTVQNSYTGGISVICYGSPATSAGDNVQVLNSNIIGSRRNNFEPLCGTDSMEIGGTNTNAGGGSLSEGVDAEPFIAGQLITGLTIKNVLFSGNSSGCIQAMFKYDTTWTMNLINNTCTAPNTTAGGVIVQTDTPVTHVANPGTLTISGGSYVAGSANSATIAVQQAARVNMIGVTSSGSARGLITCSNCGSAQAGTVTTVVSSLLNGSSVDLDCFNTVSLVGLVLANGTRASGCAPYVTAMAGGVSSSWNTDCIPFYLSNSGGQTNLNCSGNFKAIPGTNNEYYLNDGNGMIAKIQTLPGTGSYFGTESDDPMFIVQKNHPVIRPIAYGASNVSLVGILTPGSLSGGTIPACSPTYTGFLARFTDSDTQTWGATIAGGSSFGAVGYCNGSNWTVFAK